MLNAFSNSSFGSFGRTSNIALKKMFSSSVVSPVFLVELTAGETVRQWTSLGSGVYFAYCSSTEVHSVRQNGIELVEMKQGFGPSIELNRFEFTPSNKMLLIRTATDPNSSFVQVVYKYYVSDKSIEKNNTFYEGLIKNLPSLSIRLDKEFGSIVQFGNGSIELLNLNGIWDSRFNLEWLAGSCDLKIGTVEAKYSDFIQLGSWACDTIQIDNQKFGISLVEKKVNIDVEVPFSFYTYDEFPALKENDEGKAKQWAYGNIYGAEAVCIDALNQVFKVADHPISSLDSIRVFKEDGWNWVSPSSTDLVSGTFVLPSGVYDSEKSQKVSVDFAGKPDASGYLMNNASDIVLDILSNLGITEIDLESFNESKRLLELGYYGFNTNQKACIRTPSIYLNEAVRATDVIQKINDTTNAYMFIGGDGKYRFQVFKPKAEEYLVHLTESDLLSFNAQAEGGNKTSKAVIHYAERKADGFGPSVIVENVDNQYLRNQKQATIKEKTVGLDSLKDATRYAEQIVFEDSKKKDAYTIDVKWGAWFLSAGDCVHLKFDRYNLDGVFEVMEIQYSLTERKVSLTVSNMHGLSGMAGIWVSEVSKFGIDEVSSYSTNQKFQNSGHWQDSSGYIDSNYKKSVWS